MAHVIVLGSNFATTLGIVRAIGMSGYPVSLISTTKECAAVVSGSKYVEKTGTCREKYDDLFRALEAMRGSKDKALIVPTNDYVASLLDLHMEELKDHFIFPNVNQELGELTSFMDKYRQKVLATECGLAVAEGHVYEANADGIRKALSEAEYPCIVKAVSTVGCLRSKTLQAVCKDKSELEKAMLSACKKNWPAILVEQCLDIEKEYAVYGLSLNGRVIMPACLYTWRSGHGSHKGVTAEGEMLYPEMLGEDKGKLEDFVQKSGLNGLFCIDLILSKGKFYFVEMNMRYGASGYAVTMAGANLPGAYAEAMLSDHEIDKDIKMSYEPHFLNEKVELEDYRFGYISWREYKKHQKGDKIFFIKSIEDSEPWKQFRRLEKKKRLARLLRGTTRSI